MKLKKLLFFIAFPFLSNIAFAQHYYVQPQLGRIGHISKIVGNPDNYIKRFRDFVTNYGILVGRKKNKFEHQLGYFLHEIDVSAGIKKPYASWNSGYVIMHNFSYAFNYDFLQWRRIDISTGLFLHLSTSRFNIGANLGQKQVGISTPGAAIDVKNYYTIRAYERRQLMIEPHTNLTYQFADKIAWNIHLGYNIATRDVYLMKSMHKLNGIQQADATSIAKGSGMVISTGFKFYFRNKK